MLQEPQHKRHNGNVEKSPESGRKAASGKSVSPKVAKRAIPALASRSGKARERRWLVSTVPDTEPKDEIGTRARRKTAGRGGRIVEAAFANPLDDGRWHSA